MLALDPRRRRRPAGLAGGGIHARLTVEKPKDIRSTLKRLWNFFKVERKWLIVTFSLIIISGLLGVSVPFLIGKAVDAIFPGIGSVQFEKLRLIVLLLLSVYILDNLLTFLQEYIVAGIAQSMFTWVSSWRL